MKWQQVAVKHQQPETWKNPFNTNHGYRDRLLINTDFLSVVLLQLKPQNCAWLINEYILTFASDIQVFSCSKCGFSHVVNVTLNVLQNMQKAT